MKFIPVPKWFPVRAVSLAFAFAFAFASRSAAAEDISIKKDNGAWQIHTPNYDATVEPDGCMTHLAVNSHEFLRPGVDVSRGAYLWQNGLVKFLSVAQAGDSGLTAKNDQAEIRYEFAIDKINVTVTNSTAADMRYFMVFVPEVNEVVGDNGEKAQTPAIRQWKQATWLQDGASLKTTGSDGVWGPWFKLQVWDATLKANESRQVVLEPGTAAGAAGDAATRPAQADAATASPATASPATGAPVTGAPAAGEPAAPTTAPAMAAKDVAVQGDNGNLQVHTPLYDAAVEPDGCMTHLRVNGQEFLCPGVDVSRGAYFFQAGVLKLSDVQHDGNVVTAKSEKATARYEFGDDRIRLAVHNLTRAAMPFFVVLDPAVKGAMNEKGESARSPTTAAWTQPTFFRDKSKLQITGSTRIWGPWGSLQVWEATLAPDETRTIEFVPGAPTDAERKAISALPGADGAVEAVAEQDLTVLSPRDYQVAQRQSAAEGRVLFSGRVKSPCDTVEVRVSGKSAEGASLAEDWRPLPLLKLTRSFNADLALPAGGWYKAEFRATQAGQPVAQAAVEHMGVGEVFVAAGQSNSTNFGEARQSPASGMVATFNGSAWRLADDPQPGAHDNSDKGSLWPAFGDAMFARHHVPVGVAVTGHGGTSVRQWAPGGELFAWTLTRIRQLGPGGFRAVLWHQGESDWGMSGDEYSQRLTQVIWASKQAAGWEFPWIVAHASYHGRAASSDTAVRDGQQQLWDRGVALEGPDTDLLGGDNRDGGGNGIHFSAKGLQAHGRAWAEKVGAYLDQVVPPSR